MPFLPLFPLHPKRASPQSCTGEAASPTWKGGSDTSFGLPFSTNKPQTPESANSDPDLPLFRGQSTLVIYSNTIHQSMPWRVLRLAVSIAVLVRWFIEEDTANLWKWKRVSTARHTCSCVLKRTSLPTWWK